MRLNTVKLTCYKTECENLSKACLVVDICGNEMYALITLTARLHEEMRKHLILYSNLTFEKQKPMNSWHFC